MPNKNEPRKHSKLSQKKRGDKKKKDLSGIVSSRPDVQKKITIRLSGLEHTNLQNIADQVNELTAYKKISGNDVMRGLLLLGKNMKPERILKAIQGLHTLQI